MAGLRDTGAGSRNDVLQADGHELCPGSRTVHAGAVHDGERDLVDPDARRGDVEMGQPAEGVRNAAAELVRRAVDQGLGSCASRYGEGRCEHEPSEKTLRRVHRGLPEGVRGFGGRDGGRNRAAPQGNRCADRRLAARERK